MNGFEPLKPVGKLALITVTAVVIIEQSIAASNDVKSDFEMSSRW